MSGIWSVLWWKTTFENVILTFVTSLVGVLGVAGFNFGTADWGKILGAAGVAAGLALLYSIIATLRSGTVSPASLVAKPEPMIEKPAAP